MARSAPCGKSHLVIGIDEGSTVGYGVLRTRPGGQSDRLTSGSWPLRDPEEGRPLGELYEGHREALLRLLAALPATPDLLVYEDVPFRAFRGKQNLRILAAGIGVCEALGARFGIQTGEVNLMTVKATAGHGRASKEEMMAWARARWNYEPVDDNDADAMWIAETGSRLLIR